MVLVGLCMSTAYILDSGCLSGPCLTLYVYGVHLGLRLPTAVLVGLRMSTAFILGLELPTTICNPRTYGFRVLTVVTMSIAYRTY